MMLFRFAALTLIPAGLLAETVSASPQVGDKAPPIRIARWMNHKPPYLPSEAGADKSVFLVEFWATWCGPCKRSIPHLAKLHKQHAKSGLVVIGISNEDPETVAGFLKSGKPEMPYYVGCDDENATNEKWMNDIQGIPHAFLVDKSGRVAWTGNPLAETEQMDQAIADLLAGKYDLEAAKQSAVAAKKIGELMKDLQQAYNERDKEAVFRILDQMIATKPTEFQPWLIKRQLLDEFDMKDRLPEHEEKMLEAFRDSARGLCQIVRYELQREPAGRNAKLLYQSAQRANELAQGRDIETLTLWARVQCEMGMLDAAIETQKRAVALAGTDEADDIRRTLKYFETIKQVVRQ